MIHVRPATDSDADAISALWAEVQTVHAESLPDFFKPVSPNTFPPAEVRELLKQRQNVVLVACEGPTVVGYASAEVLERPGTPHRHPMTTLLVHAMGVSANWRRRGAGRALVEALRDAAKAKGIHSLLLDVWSFNSEARAFYQSVGFVSQREYLSLDVDS